VRGQTPKVAKQDKKKLPKGRAIKRLKVRAPTVMLAFLGFTFSFS
jgi:ribosomal protein S30